MTMRHSLVLDLVAMLGVGAPGYAGQPLPTGQALTPLAAPGAVFAPLVAHTGPFPDYVADGAAAVAVSPDRRELLVLTSGFNQFNAPDGRISLPQSGQYVMIYALSAKGTTFKQSVVIPNSFSGVAWAPDGNRFFVGGGVDDAVYSFARGATGFVADGASIKLGHKTGNGVEVQPQAAGVAVSPDGKHVLVANYYNDSVSLIDIATRTVIAEQDLRPGKIDPAQTGVAGGEYPFAVTWTDATHAYVTAARDREIVALSVNGTAVRVTQRIKTIGEPTALMLDKVGARLYATEDNDDRIAIIDPRTDHLIAEPRIDLPEALNAPVHGKGTNPNNLFMTPGGHLLVTLGGINALAVLDPRDAKTHVVGLIPTGWYPSAVATNRDGSRVIVVNRKSPPGPNPLGCAPKLATTKAQPTACGAANQYIFQLEKAGMLQFPMLTPRQLAKTTLQVAENIGLEKRAERARADAIMAQLHARIKHVVYIVKENRTYDQVLGDLEVGNGDPGLAILGRSLSPNHHDLARQFVTLDNFYDSGEQSSNGWTWTTAARTTDLLEKTAPVNYARRGLAYDAEEADRNIPAQMSFADRRANNANVPDDKDVLPGSALATAPDADDDHLPGKGFIWNHAIRAGLSVRNYGVADAAVYDNGKPSAAPLLRDPFKEGHPVYRSGDHDLATRSDPYFRGFDQKLADYWRLLEWQREFAQQVATHSMPTFTVMRLSHDHFGDFDKAIDKVNTVETEMADNDYAVGKLVETISQSPFADSTLIFIIEDDAQNGADHVDARRSIAFVLGAYVKQKALVSTRYTTLNMLRTIEGVLGLKPMGLNDALATPMADVFDLKQSPHWHYTAHAARVLQATDLPIPTDQFAQAEAAGDGCPVQTAAYWAEAMRGQDFSREDRLDTAAFNKALMAGLTRNGRACPH